MNRDDIEGIISRVAWARAYEAARAKWPNHEIIDATRVTDTEPHFIQGLPLPEPLPKD